MLTRDFPLCTAPDTGDLLLCYVAGFKYAYSQLPWVTAMEAFGLPMSDVVKRTTVATTAYSGLGMFTQP